MGRLLQFFIDGGLMMYPLAIVSIIALAVIVERALRLRNTELIAAPLIESVQTHLEKGDVPGATAACGGQTVLVGRVLESSLKEYANTRTDIETSLQECGQRELQVLWNNLSVLSTIAKVAPLMGLLGTVFGMIGAFEVLSEAGVGKEEMAAQIRIALVTTATGMIVAIPTLVADAYYRSRIRRILALFEDIFIDVLKSFRMGDGQAEESSEAAEIPEPPAEAPAAEGAPA